MSEVKVNLFENGPAKIEGGAKLLDHEGNEFNLEGKDTFFLCRCGSSEKKPFCDGSHKRVGFQACEKAQ